MHEQINNLLKSDPSLVMESITILSTIKGRRSQIGW